MDRRIRFWVSILLSFGQILDLSIELFSEGSSGISVVKSWAVVLKWMYRFLTNFTTELCPIPFENFEVISKINKMTRPLFTYVVQWSYGSMSYASVGFEPYLVIDARNMELTATYHPPAYVGGCHVCTFALSHLFWLCSLEGRRQQTFGETTSLLFTNRDLRSPTLLTGF